MTFRGTLSRAYKNWLLNQNGTPLFDKPIIYFSLKAAFVLAIIAQRILLYTKSSFTDQIPFKVSGPVVFLLLLLLEMASYHYLIAKRKEYKKHADVFFFVFQLIFSEAIILLSNAVPNHSDTKFTFTLQQEVFFICLNTQIFIKSLFIRISLLFYLACVTAFQINSFSLIGMTYYYSWVIMALTILLGAGYLLIFTKNKDNIPELPIKSANNSMSRLENIPHGLAILTQDRDVVFMNGVFKGILDLTDERDALQSIMKLKRFEAYPEQTQQRFLQEIKVKLDHESQQHEKKIERRKTLLGLANAELPSPDSSAGSISKKPIEKMPTIFIKRPSGPSSLLSKTIKHMHSMNAESSGLPLSPGSPKTSDPFFPKTLLQRKTLSSPYQFPLQQQQQQQQNNSAEIPIPAPPSKQFRHLSTLHTEDENTANTVGFSINSIFSSFNEDPANGGSGKGKRRVTLTQVAKNVLNGLAFRRASTGLRRADTYLNITNNNTQRVKAIHRNSKGELRILEVTLTPMQNEGKEALFVYLNDITSEMKAKDLQENNQYKDRLLKFVSHEFRTPLNCSIISLDLLKPFISKDLYLNYLAPALNSNKLLLSLCNDILDFSQIQARKLKIAISPCSLKEILNEVIDMMEMQASTAGIRLSLDWDNSIPKSFFTDGNRLKQIVLNLISNALKFTTKGSITLKASFVNQLVCKIEVIDTGVGISEQNLNQLFQEFGKIQENMNLNPQGVGLGLVISKLLSQELGPDNVGLQVKSEPGVGTTFHFLLSSKIESSDFGTFDGTDLDLSDDQGPFALMPKEKEKERKMQLVEKKKKKTTNKPPTPNGGKSSQFRARTAGPRGLGATNIDPFTFNFVHLYSKSTFSHMTTYVSSISPFPGMRGPNTRRGRKHGSNLITKHQRCMSSNTLEFTDNDSYLPKIADIVVRLNQICTCPKILIVDDNAYNLNVMKMMLKSFGIESEGVLDGEFAIQAVLDNEGHHPQSLQCKNFALIFMDVEMPRMGGFETSKALRKMMLTKEISYIPIIGVTGHNPQEKRVECLLSGMNDLVAKPVSPPMIQDLLSRWVVL